MTGDDPTHSYPSRAVAAAKRAGLGASLQFKPSLFSKENNARVRFLTAEEESRLRQAVRNEDSWTKIALAIHTGLRRGEQFGLRWEHVDFTVGIITIPRSNRGELRRVPMNDQARALLRDLPSRLKSGWVFPSQTGRTPLDAKNFVWRVFLPALERARITNFRWHDLRHTFASRLVMAGVDLRAVQELMGHQSYEMTLRYAHLAPAHTLDAVQRLCRESETSTNATGTDTGTSPPDAKNDAEKLDVETSEAPVESGASERAGDRDRTGDVQLGKLPQFRAIPHEAAVPAASDADPEPVCRCDRNLVSNRLDPSEPEPFRLGR